MRVHQIYGEAEFVGCGRPLIRDDKRLLHLRPFIARVLDTFGQLVRILMYELIVQEEQEKTKDVIEFDARTLARECLKAIGQEMGLSR